MNRMLRILVISSLLICSLGAKAVKSYRIYWDDPFVVEWIISDDFRVVIEQDSKETRDYTLKLIGEKTEIMFPLNRGAESYNDSNVYFITGQDLTDYVPDATYTLSERNGDIIIGNLKDDSVVYMFKENGGPEDVKEYTPHKEFVINPTCGFDYVDVNGNILKFSAKK